MKLKVIAFVAAFAASIGLSHASSGIYGFGVELDGTGAAAANSGTTTLYALQYNADLATGSSAVLSEAWSSSTSGTGVPTYNLGTFTQGVNTLTLTGGAFDTFKNGGSDVTGDTLFISINGNGGPYTAVTMNFGANLSDTAGNQLWDNETLSTNLLAGLGNGTYTVDVYGEAFTSDGDVYANNGGPNYTATFTVVPEPSTYVMMFAGLVALVAFQRLRRKSVS
jgi:hypothetical protein